MRATSILGLISSIIAVAPVIEQGVQDAKDLVTFLFTKKLISAAQQDALHAQVDAIAKLWQAGLVPSHWLVEPDPTTPPA